MIEIEYINPKILLHIELQNHIFTRDSFSMFRALIEQLISESGNSIDLKSPRKELLYFAFSKPASQRDIYLARTEGIIPLPKELRELEVQMNGLRKGLFDFLSKTNAELLRIGYAPIHFCISSIVYQDIICAHNGQIAQSSKNRQS